MTSQVSNVPGQADPANIPQFNWRQLAAFLLLPVAWWFLLDHQDGGSLASAAMAGAR